MRILAFAASVRKGSINRGLIEIAADIAREKGADCKSISNNPLNGYPRASYGKVRHGHQQYRHQ